MKKTRHIVEGEQRDRLRNRNVVNVMTDADCERWANSDYAKGLLPFVWNQLFSEMNFEMLGSFIDPVCDAEATLDRLYPKNPQGLNAWLARWWLQRTREYNDRRSRGCKNDDDLLLELTGARMVPDWTDENMMVNAEKERQARLIRVLNMICELPTG